jgi:3'(2'), 5'-bisphosphate nucleotidase
MPPETSALRDGDPVFRRCRIEAEETSGDLASFAAESPVTIALDPIDGTKMFRDHTGDGYAVMLHCRTRETVIGSLVYLPETGPQGTWVQAYGGLVKCGPDDRRRPAGDVLARLPDIAGDRLRGQRASAGQGDSRNIYLIGFQQNDASRARRVTEAGLKGFAPDDMPGSIYPLLATGEFAGSLIHSPNVYDFPVSLHIARLLGGDAVWVHSGESVHFGETWRDERADMLRLPGIVACAADRAVLARLAELARDWSPVRYEESPESGTARA